MKKRHIVLLFTALGLYGFTPSLWGEGMISGHITPSYRYFNHDLPGTTPPNHTLSIAAEPKYTYTTPRWIFTANPFVRWDQHDTQRSHIDIRELSAIYIGNGYEVRAGMMTVFWGVAESANLVDIINQNDFVEGFTEKAKLGQQMINLSIPKPYGTFDFFILPGFRPSTFPGTRGRFNFGLEIDQAHISYETPQGASHIDYATRWKQTLGNIDIGLHYFSGTDRTPIMSTNSEQNPTRLLVHYVPIQQVGVDVQYIRDALLLKLEAINRSTSRSRFYAYVTGFEYTFYGLFHPNWDIGIIGEYLFDERGKGAFTPNENDIFSGVRWAFNNIAGTELLAGTSWDLGTGSANFRIKAEQRLDNHWKIKGILQTFSAQSPDDLVYAFRDDDFMELSLGYWF